MYLIFLATYFVSKYFFIPLMFLYLVAEDNGCTLYFHFCFYVIYVILIMIVSFKKKNTNYHLFKKNMYITSLLWMNMRIIYWKKINVALLQTFFFYWEHHCWNKIFTQLPVCGEKRRKTLTSICCANLCMAQVRETIELLVKVLRGNGTSKIKAESFRLAKFNNDTAVSVTKQANFHIVIF